MTVRRRLFLSNILMILVPVISTALVGIFCIVAIIFSVFHGAGFDAESPEEFTYVSMTVTESIEHKLKNGEDLSSLEKLLDSNKMGLNIISGDNTIFSYGEAKKEDHALLAAAEYMKYEATISHNGRSLYIKTENINDKEYCICLFGETVNIQNYYGIEDILIVSIILIAVTIFISIILTNRFLVKFVFKKIEEPLDILSYGVRQISEGNLDYRIEYRQTDEFLSVCDDFNKMALRLKESVELIHHQERSRKELIAGISHDIRSPLTSIQAYVEGLLDGVTKTEQDRRRYLKTIKTKAEELEHMISQLFLFSKMELGENVYNPSVLRLDEVISRIVSELSIDYNRQGMEIKTELCPAEIYADSIQIRRIITNILDNSLKYKEKDNGKIIITLDSSGDRWHLSIADDGPGVPQESVPHLFEVFYRSDPSRQNPNKGSGLGLAIVEHSVHQLGGSICAKNRPQGGLEIEITFLRYEENRDGKDINC